MYTSLIRPLLFQLDPEKAHHLSTRLGTAFCRMPVAGPRIVHWHGERWSRLGQQLLGIRFGNPVGMAAGFDKNAVYADLLRFLGFGFVEYGSVTARPSSGNPRPRLFRLGEDRALINRMGLNNHGAEAVCWRLKAWKTSRPELFEGYPSGMNIAKTHNPAITGDDAIRDYVTSYRFARNVGDYITLNISCPNTREGKTFEDGAALAELLCGCNEVRKDGDPPLLIKFSPDTDERTGDTLLSVCEDHAVSGYVVTNTSRDRDALRTPRRYLDAIGAGGLSGGPLFAGMRRRLIRMRSQLARERMLVACGGIDSPEKALQLLGDGADLLQLYTGLVYEGPGLVARINDALVRKLNDMGAPSLAQWRAQLS